MTIGQAPRGLFELLNRRGKDRITEGDIFVRATHVHVNVFPCLIARAIAVVPINRNDATRSIVGLIRDRHCQRVDGQDGLEEH